MIYSTQHFLFEFMAQFIYGYLSKLNRLMPLSPFPFPI